MKQPPLPQLEPLCVDTKTGILRSNHYDDLFFSAENGLAESHHVFIDGTGLKDLLAQNNHLTIAETGFGTGLNVLALCQAVKQTKSDCQIDYISFESCPLNVDLVQLAHRPFNDIHLLSAELCTQWPRRWHGVHYLSLLSGQVRVHLHYGLAQQTMPRLAFGADVWFLDGFSSAKNPELWSLEICQQIARLSARNARLATFSVARSVREHLQQVGFEIEKSPGFGTKRDMLKAQFHNGLAKKSVVHPQLVAIIGGGIAGAAMAHALAERQIDHLVIERGTDIAAGASGNPQGLLVPFLSVGDMPAARLSISALAHSRRYADRHNLVLSSGVISLDFSARKAKRQALLAEQGFAPDLACYLDREEVSDLCGLDIGCGGLFHEAAAVISPIDYCKSLLNESKFLTQTQFMGLEGCEGDWQLKLNNGKNISASHIIYCGGADTPQMDGLKGWASSSFQITSGQLSYLPETTSLSRLKMALNYSGYMMPAYQGRQIIGASFNHHASTDIDEQGHQQNLELIPTQIRPFAGQIKDWHGRRSCRLAVPDRLPLAGAISPTRYVLGALGARGLTLAPFLAESLACRIEGRTDFLDQPLQSALSPDRMLA